MTVYSYWFMFRVGDVGEDQKRRQSIYDAMERQNPDGGFWYEPTSSGLIRSSMTAYYFVQHVTRGLIAKHDLLIAVDVNSPADAAYFGNVTLPNVVAWFLPMAKKVT